MYLKAITFLGIAVFSTLACIGTSPRTTTASSAVSSTALAIQEETPNEKPNPFGRVNSFYSQQRSAEEAIKKAARSLRTAESTDDKKAAEKTLRDLLSKDYDSRLAGYEKHLDEMEAKLKEMRTKLKRRRDAKSEMIDLRVKVLEAEADDLGWPARTNSRSLLPSGFGRSPLR